MKKTVFITLLILSSLHSSSAQNYSKIDEVLLQEMALQAKSEKLPVCIVLKAQYDQKELRNNAQSFKNKEEKRTYVVYELKNFSAKTQTDLISILSALLENAGVSEIQSFWISNSISCLATIDVIEELSSHPDILLVGLNNMQNLLPDNEKPTPAEPTREITYNILNVKADQVWGLGYTGEGVVVGILDTGVNYNHEDLQGNMWEHPDFPYHGYNFVSNNDNPLDDHGHGTHCAGTIAGHGAAGSKTGVAPQAKIMAIKTQNAQGEGNLSQLLNGIQFAVEHGANVLSMSIGFRGNVGLNEKIQLRNAMNNVLEAGIIASVAAGNDGSNSSYPVPNNVHLPGSCPPPWLHPDQTLEGGLSAVVSIGAINAYDILASFSSRGPVTWQTVPDFNDYPYLPDMGLIRPDVVAPGVNIKSLRHDSNTGYALMDGTSMATPCVAGVMALMLSVSPNLTPAEICEILQITAFPLTSTKSNMYGAGRVNALDAVNYIISNDYSFELLDIVIPQEEPLVAGDTSDILIYLKNTGKYKTFGVTGTIISNSEYLTINQSEHYYGTFYLEQYKYRTYNITISSSTPPELTEFEITMIVYDETGKKRELFSQISVSNSDDPPQVCASVNVVYAEIIDSSLKLSWEAPESIAEKYLIYFNDDFLAATDETTYIFEDIEPAAIYTFCIEALYSDGCTSDLSCYEFTTPCFYFLDLSGEIVSETEILLHWQSDSDELIYNIYRNSEFLIQITGNSFLDTELELHKDYCYTVTAMCNETSESEHSNEECFILVGIDRVQSQVRIYPNPTKGEFKISGLKFNDRTLSRTLSEVEMEVEIYDVFGRSVLISPSFGGGRGEVDISHLPNGVYFIVIEGVTGEKEAYKIVKR